MKTYIFKILIILTAQANRNNHSSLLQKFQNGKHNVVDVAETWSFWLFGMVKAASPVDCDVCCLFVQLHRPGLNNTGTQTLYYHAADGFSIASLRYLCWVKVRVHLYSYRYGVWYSVWQKLLCVHMNGTLTAYGTAYVFRCICKQKAVHFSPFFPPPSVMAPVHSKPCWVLVLGKKCC